MKSRNTKTKILNYFVEIIELAKTLKWNIDIVSFLGIFITKTQSIQLLKVSHYLRVKIYKIL